MWPFLTLLALLAVVAIHYRWRQRWLAGQIESETLKQKAASVELESRLYREQENKRQETIFNSMIEGFLLLDTQHRVVSVNSSLQRMFGVDGSIRGLTLMEAFRLHPLSTLSEQVDREGQVREYELALPGFPNPRFLEVNAAALHAKDHQYQGSIFIFHDVTRLKQLENMRKEFVANVSHELRTPLTLIKGYVETLLDGAKDDPQVRERFLQTIHKHSNRLASLIEDLLNLSRLESGQIALRKKRVSLRDLCERVVEELEGSASSKRITILNHVPAEVPVEVDPDRLQQVLFNLVDNAIKYGRPSGTVNINLHRTPGLLQVSVQDDGPGIPPDSLERVFERFYRVDRARSRDAGGTGLGLSIVKHIVQSHGGEAWAESQFGQGSTFFFTLPEPTAEPDKPLAA